MVNLIQLVVLETVTGILIAILVFVCWQKIIKNEICENNKNGINSERFNEVIYRKRMKALLVYLLLGFFLLLLWFHLWRVETLFKYSHFTLCLAANFMGAFIYGYKWRIRSKADPNPAYSIYYPIIIISLSCLTYSFTSIVLNIAKINDKSIYYSLSFFIGIFCGQYLDNVKDVDGFKLFSR
jgi:hypothetical protein